MNTKGSLPTPRVRAGLLLAIVLSANAAHGQGMPVIDVAAIAQAIQQVALATQQLEAARAELERLGDPKLIKTPAAEALIRSLGLTGVGRTLDEIQFGSTGAIGAGFDANGLYRPPTQILQTADGRTTTRPLERYRQFGAIAEATKTAEEVMRDTEERRQELRRQIQSTLRDLQAATTVTEIQKLQGILSAQTSELSAIDRERDAANHRVVVQNIENQTDAARQKQARREEVEASVLQTTDQIGKAFKVDSSTVRIPDVLRR